MIKYLVIKLDDFFVNAVMLMTSHHEYIAPQVFVYTFRHDNQLHFLKT